MDAQVQTVWKTFETWASAQGYLLLYQQKMKEVEDRLKGFTEQQRTLFYSLTTFNKPGEKTPEEPVP